jgi:hypothetical protein
MRNGSGAVPPRRSNLVQSKFSRGTLVSESYPVKWQFLVDPCRNRVPGTVTIFDPFPYLVSVSVRHGESLFARHALFSESKGPIGFALMRDGEFVNFRWHAIFINPRVLFLVAHADNGNAYGTISRSINKVNCPLLPPHSPFQKHEDSTPFDSSISHYLAQTMRYSLLILAPLFAIANAAPAIIPRDDSQTRICPYLPVKDGGCIRCKSPSFNHSVRFTF